MENIKFNINLVKQGLINALDIFFSVINGSYIDNYYEIINGITQSDAYNECQGLYKKYISNLGYFIGENATDESSLSFACMFQYLLENGYLSYNGKENYFDYKYDNYDCILDFMGPRVLTGNSVCRHKSSMLTDLLNVCGFDSVNLAVHFWEEDSISKKENINRPNHLVTGIIDKDGKYIYDATLFKIATSSLDVNKDVLFESIKGNINYKLCETKSGFNADRLELVDKFNDTDTKIFSNDYIDFVRCGTIEKMKNSALAYDFFKENDKLVNEIVNLYISLIPYANKKQPFQEEVLKVKKLYL